MNKHIYIYIIPARDPKQCGGGEWKENDDDDDHDDDDEDDDDNDGGDDDDNDGDVVVDDDDDEEEDEDDDDDDDDDETMRRWDDETMRRWDDETMRRWWEYYDVDVEEEEEEEEDDYVEEDNVEEEDRSQDRETHLVRACAVEMHMDMSQEAFCAEIYRENAYASDTTSIEHRALTVTARTPQCGHTVWGIKKIKNSNIIHMKINI